MRGLCLNFLKTLFGSIFTARHHQQYPSFKALEVYLIPDIVYILSHSAGLGWGEEAWVIWRLMQHALGVLGTAVRIQGR